MRESSADRKPARRLGARDMAAISAAGLTLAATAALAAALSAVLPPLTAPWLGASGYAAAVGLAFAVYWWVAQRA